MSTDSLHSDSKSHLCQLLNNSVWWDKAAKSKYSFVANGDKPCSGTLWLRFSEALIMGEYQISTHPTSEELQIALKIQDRPFAYYTVQILGSNVHLIPHHHGKTILLEGGGPFVASARYQFQYS